MSSGTRLVLLKRITSLIEDDNEVLTYKTVSRKLGASAVEARTLLAEYLESRRAKFAGNLHVLYCLSGDVQLQDGSSETKIVIVPEDVVDEWEEKHPGFEKHVYSVHTMEIEDMATLSSVDYPVNAEGIRSIIESNSIDSPQIHSRTPSEKSRTVVPGNQLVMTAKTLKKVETEERKFLSEVGESLHVLKIKHSSAVDAPGLLEKKAKVPIASWIKATDLNPKKAVALKEMMDEERRKPASPTKAAAASDSEDECFAPKKSKTMARNALESDSDSELPVDPSTLMSMVVDEESVESPNSFHSSNKTLIFGDGEASEVGENVESAVIPEVARKEAATGKSESLKNRKKTALDGIDGTDKALSLKKPRKSKMQSTSVPKTFGELTGVSDAEDIEEGLQKGGKKGSKVGTVQNASKQREVSKKPSGKRTVLSDEEIDQCVSKQSSVSSSLDSTKKAKDVSISEEADSDPETKPKIRKAKPSAARKRAKKNNFYGDASTGDISDDDGRGHNSPFVENSEPLRPFLKATPSQETLRRKQVMIQRVDDDGYTVNEMVWRDLSAEELNEKPSHGIQSSDLPLRSKVTSPVTEDNAEIVSVLKKNSQSIVKGKSVQSSIMNFFKKS